MKAYAWWTTMVKWMMRDIYEKTPKSQIRSNTNLKGPIVTRDNR